MCLWFFFCNECNGDDKKVVTNYYFLGTFVCIDFKLQLQSTYLHAYLQISAGKQLSPLLFLVSLPSFNSF